MPDATRRLARLLALAAATLPLSLAACSSDDASLSPDKPLADLKNKDLQLNQRTIALEEVWAAAQSDPARLPAAREASKDLLWKGGAPEPLRQRALALLLTDNSPEGLADTRKVLALRLPTESGWRLIGDICKAAAERASDPAWKSLTASLVRSYARKVDIPPDPDRPERGALLALHPNTPLERIIYEVFVRPADNGAPKVPEDSADKARAAAWDLLGRLDPQGAVRTQMIGAETRDEPVLKDLARSARELGVTPITGSELSWLKRLLNDRDPRNAQWWSETAAALQRLSTEQRQGLSMRHLEPVRWAAQNRAQWLGASRAELMQLVAGRIDSRRHWLKASQGEGGDSSREMLSDHSSSIAWGDLLAILIIDDAMQDPKIVQDLFAQAMDDRADESTEYGGMLIDKTQAPKPLKPDSGAGDVFLVRGYSPRPAQRVNDRTFVASEDMFAQSARSFAHYHFHAQTDRNGDYAGPGRGDSTYADLHGVNCLVLTTVRDGVMNVDYYVRGDVVVDLGEIHRAR